MTSAPPRPPRHIALLIGIADYKNFAPPPGEPGHTDLNGPGNDVERMRISLRRFGFAGDSNVRVLRDSVASRRGIAAGFRWLAERATDSGDVVVVFYSGHGSRARDTNGDEARTTSGDTTDEALVPWDAVSTSDPQQLVLDDQLGQWLAALGTSNVTMIVDGCFSGTVTRGLGRIVAKGTFGSERVDPGRSQRQLLDNPAHTLITAAAPQETAYEMPFGPDHRWFGAFTYELTRALDGAESTARYDEIMQEVTRAMRDNPDAPQTPQLEGDRSALLFRVAATVPRQAFVLVTPLGGDRVTIDAGAVHGVRHSAVYDVYASGETTFDGRSRGQIIIDSVGETASRGQVLADPAAFGAGARAVLARVPRGAERVEALRLYIAPAAAPVRRRVESLHFIRISDSVQADAQLSVSRAGGFDVLLTGTPVAALAQEGGGQELCPRLARAFAIKAFDAIDNPAAPLSLELESRFVESGTPVPTEAADVDTMYIGRSYDLYVRVGAREGETLYLTAASEGYTGPPALIFPDPTDVGLNQPFAPLNQWRRIMNGIPANEPTGLEIVKLLVGGDQYDFRTFIQTLPACTPTGMREVPSAPPAIRWRARAHRVRILREIR
ncbi:MAG TPA: caspase family protein [Gemmatimonadales bacterium]|jgi:hypothetical protein|nr:caspase family protein [Gemmatimonadales bacterium]